MALTDARFIDPQTGRVKVGKLVVLQVMGKMTDDKIHFVGGEDQTVFNLEDGDQFFIVIFQTDPFEQMRKVDE